MRKNPAIQRDLLGAAVLHLRSGRAASRSSLALALNVAPSTVGLYVDQLIADGYVDESGLEQGPLGRPKRRLATLPGAGWFAGVEFNAARVQAVSVNFSGQQVTTQSKWLPPGADTRTVLQTLKQVVATLAKNTPGPLLAIGAGAPGIIDPATGVAAEYTFIPDWRNVPLAASLRERFEVPVTVENNLRVIALAERWFGGGRDLDDYVVLGPRSGFGLAIVHHGELMRGAHFAAGEIGRLPWPFPDSGTRGELHDMLSAPFVWRRLAGASPRSKTPEDLRSALTEFAGAGTPAWNEIVSDYARVLGCLQLLFDTECFFLHGPLTSLGERFCRDVIAAIRATTPALAEAPLRLVPSTLGDDAGALGAASLAMEAWVPSLVSV
jgi:predicted NBD/HSP70 family sugar kinase